MPEALVGRFEDLVPGSATRVEVDDLVLAVVRIGDEVFAIADRCSHEDFPLSEGEVFEPECELECARHGASFDLRTGAPCSLPATVAVATYPTVVRDGEVWVHW